MPESSRQQPFPLAETAALVAQPIGRRAILAGFVGASAAVLLGGCGGGEKSDYYPDLGHPSVAPSVEYPGASNVPEDGVSPWGSGSAATDAPETPEADARTEQGPAFSPYETKAEIVGYKLPLHWANRANRRLANAVRARGKDVDADPKTESLTNRDFYRKAIVIGVPAAQARGKKLQVALAMPGEYGEYSGTVAFATLPTGRAKDAHGQAVEQLPTPVDTSADMLVHPYRLRKGPAGIAVAFLVTGGGKTQVVRPYVLNHHVDLINGTYSNAHVI